MLNLFIFENLKFCKYRKTKILAIFFAVYLIGSIGIQHYKSLNYMSTTSEALIKSAKFHQIQAAALHAEYEYGFIPEDPIELKMLLDRIELFTDLGRYENTAGYFIGEEDLSQMRIIMSSLIRSHENLLKGFHDDLFTQEEILERRLDFGEINQKYNYLIQLDTDESEVVLNPYLLNGVSALRTFFDYDNLFIISLFIFMFFMDFFLIENEMGTYKVVMSNPSKRWHIYFAKMGTMVIWTVILLMGALVFKFLSGWLIGGTGNWQYLAMSRESLFYLTSNGLAAEPIVISDSLFITKATVLWLVISVFTVVLINVVSIFTDSMMVTLFIGMGIVASTFVLGLMIPSTSALHMWHPFMYMFVAETIQVTRDANYLLGMLIVSVCTVFMILLGNARFLKKDFLGPK